MRTKARHYYPPIKKCRGSTLTHIHDAKKNKKNPEAQMKWSWLGKMKWGGGWW
jgi:hypothetical protein